MVLAATILLFQFAAIQPAAGLEAQSRATVDANANALQTRPAGVRKFTAWNSTNVEPLGVRNLSHVHLLAGVSTSEASGGKNDGASSPASPSLKTSGTSEGTESPIGIIAAPAPAAPLPALKAGPSRIRKTSSKWLLLTIAQHSAATFDAWSTRHALTAGGRYEADPLMRPFANSSALYGAIQMSPLVLDYFGHWMSHSDNTILRRMWWLPQSFATAGFLFSGSHNLIHSR